MSSRSRIDWNSAKIDYISNKDMTYPLIAEKYKTTAKYVKKIASREAWNKEKDLRWARATEKALDKAEDSMANLIVRQAKIAKYLQTGGIKYLSFLLGEIEQKIATGDDDGARSSLKSLMANKIISGGNLIKMISEGLKAERNLYPKQLEIKGDIAVTEAGMSEELEQAVYESFRTKLGRGKPSIHTNLSQKTKVKKG